MGISWYLPHDEARSPRYIVNPLTSMYFFTTSTKKAINYWLLHISLEITRIYILLTKQYGICIKKIGIDK